MLLCLLLPLPHLTTLRYIMCFLSRVAKQSSNNKMDTPNLAVCMAPNLMHNNPKAEKMNSESKLLHVSSVPYFDLPHTMFQLLHNLFFLGCSCSVWIFAGSDEHRAPVNLSRAGDRGCTWWPVRAHVSVQLLPVRRWAGAKWRHERQQARQKKEETEWLAAR